MSVCCRRRARRHCKGDGSSYGNSTCTTWTATATLTSSKASAFGGTWRRDPVLCAVRCALRSYCAQAARPCDLSRPRCTSCSLYRRHEMRGWEHVLLFQTDSVLCAASAHTVEQFLQWARTAPAACAADAPPLGLPATPLCSVACSHAFASSSHMRIAEASDGPSPSCRRTSVRSSSGPATSRELWAATGEAMVASLCAGDQPCWRHCVSCRQSRRRRSAFVASARNRSS